MASDISELNSDVVVAIASERVPKRAWCGHICDAGEELQVWRRHSIASSITALSATRGPVTSQRAGIMSEIDYSFCSCTAKLVLAGQSVCSSGWDRLGRQDII
eukprot:6198141-Pleurochrysis_carterae.AAC.5